MRTLKFVMAFALAIIGFSANAQINFNDPQWAMWGEDAASREKNMLNSTFLKEAIDNKDYDKASTYLSDLIVNAPAASDAIYARGILLYRNKINRATTLAQKKSYVDSLILMHDLRLENFANHPTRGAAYITDSKARMYAIYDKNNREGMRNAFKQAIEAGGANTKTDLVLLYFQNLCDDYAMDEVMADEVVSEYERLAPFFENLEGEDAEMRNSFEAVFGQSGAASCENLEALFAEKIAADPQNVDLLSKAVSLMDRSSCKTPFFAATAEKLYALQPNSASAMALAAIFQNEGDFAKASKYLTDALAQEEDVEAKEVLYSRIALVEVAASRMAEAAKAARAAIATEDDDKSDNGIAFFALAQAYAASASSCGEAFDRQTVYWAAYDAMQNALANFSADESQYVEPAKQMLAVYASNFPSAEECFFNEVTEGTTHAIKCGIASGVRSTVRIRK